MLGYRLFLLVCFAVEELSNKLANVGVARFSELFELLVLFGRDFNRNAFCSWFHDDRSMLYVCPTCQAESFHLS